MLEEGRDRSERSFRCDCVEGCLEGVNRRQETREESCGVGSGDEEGRILLGCWSFRDYLRLGSGVPRTGVIWRILLSLQGEDGKELSDEDT